MQKSMKQKKTYSIFDKVRLTLRVIGGVFLIFPVVAYSIFAIAFLRIQTVIDYEASTRTVVQDQAYEISQAALPIANFGWTYLLPICFLIAVFDIVVAIRRQYINGERKMY
jgi:hypothetical protein